MSESEPLLRESVAASAPAANTIASSDVTETPPRQQLQRNSRPYGEGRAAVAATGAGGANGDEACGNQEAFRGKRSLHGPLLFPCGSSYESLGVCCTVGACFPCPLTWPCVWSHSHGRLLSPLSAARLATFSLFFLFVFVPWVLLRVPLSVARAEAYAPLADGGGGRGIPRSTVVECLRLIKIDDVAFWVSVGLTAAALFAAGVLRFVVRRRHGIEGGCGSCCGGGRGRDRENATTANAKCSGGDETSTTASSSSLSSFFTLAPLLLSDLLAWLLCPACALCQEARSAAAWEREKRAVDAVRARVANGGGGEEEGEQEEALLLLEAPPVPRAFDRGSEV